MSNFKRWPNLDSYLDPDRHDPALQEKPETEEVECAQCGDLIEEGQEMPVNYGTFLCPECYAGSHPDPLDYVDFDGSHE